MRLFILALAAIGLGPLGLAAPAFADGVKLASSVREEIVTIDTKGERKVKLTEPTSVAPGDVVVISIAYENAGTEPAANIVISNPVPEHLRFIDVRQGVGMVSVDGGESFGALVDLKVREADQTSRPATAADVTHVRWRFDQPLPPGASGAVAFAARLD